jgi:hypothetical protein
VVLPRPTAALNGREAVTRLLNSWCALGGMTWTTRALLSDSVPGVAGRGRTLELSHDGPPTMNDQNATAQPASTPGVGSSEIVMPPGLRDAVPFPVTAEAVKRAKALMAYQRNDPNFYYDDDGVSHRPHDAD